MMPKSEEKLTHVGNKMEKKGRDTKQPKELFMLAEACHATLSPRTSVAHLYEAKESSGLVFRKCCFVAAREQHTEQFISTAGECYQKEAEMISTMAALIRGISSRTSF